MPHITIEDWVAFKIRLGDTARQIMRLSTMILDRVKTVKDLNPLASEHSNHRLMGVRKTFPLKAGLSMIHRYRITSLKHVFPDQSQYARLDGQLF